MPEIYREDKYRSKYHYPNRPVFPEPAMDPLFHTDTHMLFPGLVGWKQENIARNFLNSI